MLLDIETGSWESGSLPRLNLERKFHSSCASDDCAYVFGGLTGIGSTFYINPTIESLSFTEERNWRGKSKSLKWIVFQIPDFQPREDAIMTVLDSEDVFIFGGKSSKYLTNGVVLNPLKKQIKR